MTEENLPDPDVEPAQAGVPTHAGEPNARAKKKLPVPFQLGIIFGVFLAIFAIGWISIAVFLRDENVASQLALHPTVGSDGFIAKQIGSIKCEPLTIPGPQDTQLRAMLLRCRMRKRSLS